LITDRHRECSGRAESDGGDRRHRINAGFRGDGDCDRSEQRHDFGYVPAPSVIVVFAGAAGMFAFENETAAGIKMYGDALWWTAMMITTIGSEYFPKTAEGRVLCFILALYGFAVFGYMTATLATYFVRRDAESKESEIAGAEDLKQLRGEIALLRGEIKSLNQKIETSPGGKKPD
jgi:voltage-gated potassium channel